ncbi:MAG TPA: membrane protein insertase YidC [Streptosporangiaceae bacterium]
MGNPLNILYDAVGWIVTKIWDGLSPIFGASSGWTWALTIIILVVAMRLVMVPLFIKQMHTTRAMSSLQPQMAALRKRYKNDKQTLNQETMKLYQEAGVNPLMGCLPVVAQLPLFFALFSVLRAIAEWKPGQVPKYHLTLEMVTAAEHAKILGVSIADKFLFTGTLHVPLHAKAVILLAVLVSMATTYLTVRQSMKRGMMPAASPDNPMGNSQKYMAYIMPFFALTGLYWPFGLVLYWVTTNLWTLAQQWALFKRYPWTPPSPVADGAPAPALAPKGISSSRAPRARAGQNGGAVNGSASGSAKPAANGKAAPAAKSAASGKPASGGAAASRAASGKTQTGSRAGDAQANGAGAGSMLRKLGRGRSEPEPAPEPEEPDVKLVRQQRQRQSRSKRSGGSGKR